MRLSGKPHMCATQSGSAEMGRDGNKLRMR